MVDTEEILNTDYNLSPSRYIQINESEVYRSSTEIMVELRNLEKEAILINAEVKEVLDKLGIR